MIDSLPTLIAPLSEAAFFELLRTRSIVFQRAADPTRFAGLLDWDGLMAAIGDGAIPRQSVRVRRGGSPTPSQIYAPAGRIDMANLTRLLDRGASLAATPLERQAPALDALCADISNRIGEVVYAGAIMTMGDGGDFGLHFDPQDLLILQLEGSKRWRMYGPPAPVPGASRSAPPSPGDEPVFDETLEPGDLLFVPAGYWHLCDGCTSRSLHAGIFIEPPTAWHALNALLAKVLREEVFRAPLTRVGGPEARAAHEAALKARLIQAIEQTSLADMLALYAAAQATSDPPQG